MNLRRSLHGRTAVIGILVGAGALASLGSTAGASTLPIGSLQTAGVVIPVAAPAPAPAEAQAAPAVPSVPVGFTLAAPATTSGTVSVPAPGSAIQAAAVRAYPNDSFTLLFNQDFAPGAECWSSGVPVDPLVQGFSDQLGTIPPVVAVLPADARPGAAQLCWANGNFHTAPATFAVS